MFQRIAPCRLVHALSSTTFGRQVAAFSTTACTELRQRLGRRNPTANHADTGRASAQGEHRLVEPASEANSTSRPDQTDVPATRPLQHHSAENKSEPSDAQVKQPVRPKKRPRRGMKPYQQSLLDLESICYRHEDTTAAVPTSRKDKPPLAAAAQFFENGCRLLYSADTLYNHVRNDHIPEIVVLGASNAGKSSFLNALIGKRDFARVSQRPGRTTTMNAYGIGPRPKIPRELVRKGDAPPKHSLILVDTPGYGFRSQSEWGDTILKYLDVRKMLRGAVLLIPTDKKLHEMDKWMLKTLARTNTRTLVVLTKADKNGEEWGNACSKMAATLRGEIQRISKGAARSWAEEYGDAAQIYATAANMDISNKLGNGGGLGGVRLAVLEMAGYALQERVEQRPETKTYAGPIVSFDDIQWKT
jgi:GTP-binding protein